ELPKLTGTSAEGSSAWRELGSWVRSLGETDMTTLVLGVSALCLILGLRFSASRFPGALVLVAGGILLTRLLDLQVALVGEVPSGFPSFVAPDLAYLANHLSVITPAAIGILLIGFSQSAGDAREYAARHKYRVDIDRESIAQGVANVGSGLVQGIPVATSLSASSLNDQSGAKTQMSSLVTGGIVVVDHALSRSPVLRSSQGRARCCHLDAVLFGMIDLPGMGRLYRVQRFDFWISIAALLGVLTFGVLAGVIIGMVLSIIWLIRSSTHPNVLELGNQPGTEQYRGLETYPDDTTFPGLLIIRFDGALFFATADTLHDRLRDLLRDRQPPIRTVVIDCESVNFVDSQGAEKLRELHELAGYNGIELWLTRLKSEVIETLARDGLVELFGEDRILTDTHGAVAAHLRNQEV
ncbi:MAG TPA: SulP family inorganic anion transporter, partial [Acidimicrobiia bacterium]